MKKIFYIIILLALVYAGYGYIQKRINESKGRAEQEKVFTIEKGEGVVDIANKLEEEGLIKNDAYFLFHIWKKGLKDKLIAGDYLINPQLSIPEIAVLITTKDSSMPEQKNVIFPEGWNSKKMAERLTANEFEGDKFLKIVNDPGEDLLNEYSFLSSTPDGASLEGYLFPDTYFFAYDCDEETIVRKMMDNFEKRLSANMIESIKSQNKTIHEIVTMASIIENEVRTGEDRKIVSGIFWNRIDIGMPLQSDAPLTYILGIKKSQYSYNDSRVDSPYNTYLNKGLPPGPISNPGISAINAAIHPTQTNYLYFLNNPETGVTVFSRSFDEHVANKEKNGL